VWQRVRFFENKTLGKVSLDRFNTLLIKCRYMNTDEFSLTLVPRHVEFLLRTNGDACIVCETKVQEADDA
jgi:hypothetical protein